MMTDRERHPIRLALATAAVAAMAAALPHPAGAETQVNDKWITVVLPAEPPDLEGCNSSRAFNGRVVKQNVVEGLVFKNPADGSLKPWLATSWEQVDPLNWRFKLRDGVTFHDGSKFNAQAVKTAIDREFIKVMNCQDKAKFFGDLTLEVTPIDDLTVMIKTSRPEPILPMRFAGMPLTGPNSAVDKPSIAPVGTGPYAFDSWQTGQQILLKRYDKYWGEKPQAEGARYIWRDVSSVRASMVANGEADIALTIAEQDATNPKTDFSYLNSETTFLRMDTTMAPFNDRRVRLAANYALDRAGMIGTIMPKSVIQATQIVMPSIPGHNHELDKHIIPYDPAKARQLLAEAKKDGVPVDTEITFITYPPHFPNASELMEAFATQLRDVGFNLKVITVEPGLYGKWNNKPFPDPRPVTIMQSSHDNNSGDPVFSVFHKFACEGVGSMVCDPEMDKAATKAGSLGGEERVKAWQEILRHQYEDIVTSVFLYHMVGFSRVNPRIDFVPDVTTNAEVRIQEIHFR
jgi:peptide/nickel transport system substrate-binding protein